MDEYGIEIRVANEVLPDRARMYTHLYQNVR